MYHPFTPAHAADSLHQVDLQKLWDEGKRLLLVDVDNTLVQWRGEDFSPEVMGWLDQAKALGFDICILSNTKNVERLARISQLLGVETVRGTFKPSRAMYRLACIKFKRKPSEAVMIGDQLMTDILGANRSGIEAIWVRKMASKEFGPTAINRMIERFLTGGIYQALLVPVDETPGTLADEQAKPVAQKTLVHQLVKFCVVGGTSFVIDTGLTLILMDVIHINGQKLSQVVGQPLMQYPLVANYANSPENASAFILGGIASLVAMFNSFVWNRRWTFEVRGKAERAAQLRRFYAISLVGLLINDAIFTHIYNGLDSSSRSKVLAKVVAAAVVAVWNFGGQRMYAFRNKPA